MTTEMRLKCIILASHVPQYAVRITNYRHELMPRKNISRKSYEQ